MNPTRVALLSFFLTYFAQAASAAQTAPSDATATLRPATHEEDLAPYAAASDNDDRPAVREAGSPAIREAGSPVADATPLQDAEMDIRPIHEDGWEYTTFARR